MTAVTMAIESPAAINAYSIAVPCVSVKNACSNRLKTASGGKPGPRFPRHVQRRDHQPKRLRFLQILPAWAVVLRTRTKFRARHSSMQGPRAPTSGSVPPSRFLVERAQDADEVGHAGAIAAVNDGRRAGLRYRLATLQEPPDEFDNQLHEDTRGVAMRPRVWRCQEAKCARGPIVPDRRTLSLRRPAFGLLPSLLSERLRITDLSAVSVT